MYLSDDTMKKYDAGYKKASTVLHMYINTSPKMSDILAKKAGNDPEPMPEIVPTYYRLKHINKDIRKGLAVSMSKAGKGFQLIGYITLFGTDWESVLGHLYQDTSGNKIAVPLPENRQFFM